MTKKIIVGGTEIGGGAPISVQSMCNTKTDDIESTVNQIRELKNAGCDIVRIAIPDLKAAKAIGKIKESIDIPLVADIHFDYKLALEAASAGIDKIRINPGNIGDKNKVKLVVDACKQRNIPIRIGVNSGSLEKDILAKYGGVTAEALVESALGHVKILNEFDFDDICISVKSSDVPMMVEAYEMLSERTDYPLHIGVTESGTKYMGLIKSSIGIGSLLLKGIGDTIRVSLTADPVEEPKAGVAILKSLGIRKDGVMIVSCPTCGRTKIDLINIAEEVEKRLSNCKKNITVAVMGCVVNGPGEASSADYGMAGGDGVGVLFKKGVIVKRNIPMIHLVDELIDLVNEE